MTTCHRIKLERSVSQICSTVNTVHELKTAVFLELTNNFEKLCEMAILSPKNTSVAKINGEHAEKPIKKPSNLQVN